MSVETSAASRAATVDHHFHSSCPFPAGRRADDTARVNDGIPAGAVVMVFD
ncbi:hypothetical protein AB0K00_30380 [Dactylosporangium sp. NPDC049525]|uniref:hypothetical protein n=1 Tax=Dactylosporangium sp. NPDC049525 TaxID=3154730 RepID=UPI003420C37F